MILSWLAAGGLALWLAVAVALVAWALLVERLLVLFGPGSGARQRRQELRGLISAGADAWMVALAEAPELTRGLDLLRACAALLPILGLLGTVDGLIRVFADILDGAPAAGSGSGISRALISTQFSLAAALPVVLGERLCRRRANQLSRQVAGVRP